MQEVINFFTSNYPRVEIASEILGRRIRQIDERLDEVMTSNPGRIVIDKAIKAYEKMKSPVLVDDNSLFFDAWNGLPGPLIGYFMRKVGNVGLLKMLKDENNRVAYARTMLCYYDREKFVIACGEVKGEITREALGDNGFGWDPIFKPDGYDLTFGQMTDEEKDKISMRRKAFEDLEARNATINGGRSKTGAFGPNCRDFD